MALLTVADLNRAKHRTHLTQYRARLRGQSNTHEQHKPRGHTPCDPQCRCPGKSFLLEMVGEFLLSLSIRAPGSSPAQGAEWETNPPGDSGD